MKKAVIITGKVNGYEAVNALLNKAWNEIPEIGEFLNNHILKNGQIFNNDCYSIEFGTKQTIVYLNNASIVTV